MRQGKVNHFISEMRLECSESTPAERADSADGNLGEGHFQQEISMIQV